MNQKSFTILGLILTILITTLFPLQNKTILAAEVFPFIVLSEYERNLSIRDEFYLIAFTSTGDFATFKSSASSIAAVDSFGRVTARKAGIAMITAKIKNAEASCRITVEKTSLTLSKSTISLERNERFSLTVSTSNGSPVTFKSNKKGVAQVDENGCILGVKPGEAIVTATADGTSKTCRVLVKQPSIKLDKTSVTLYRGESCQLTAAVSSNVAPAWKSNRSKIAAVDDSGKITAIKHGNAVITAKVDGTVKICEVIVKSPSIKLSNSELQLRKGESSKLTATVSSGHPAAFQSSNSSVATVDEYGNITAVKSGTAYITASEDGTKVKCKITVIK